MTTATLPQPVPHRMALPDGPRRIVWGMVAYGPYPYSPVYMSHMRAIAYTSRHCETTLTGDSKIAGVGASDRMYTHSAENRIVEDFLSLPDATHLFLTEMDMVLPHDALVKLLALDKPIASGLYFLRGGDGQPCLYAKSITPASNPYPHSPVTGFPTETPFKLGTLGGCPGLGCVLIAREVFERIEKPWFDLKEYGYGSDMYFYTKVRDAGFEVWVDPTVRCGQMDTVCYSYEDYEARLKREPGFRGHGFIITEESAA